MDDKNFELFFQKYLIPSLSKEEELDCVVTIYLTDNPQEKEECFKKIIRATLNTVLNLARKYRNKGIPLEELTGEGYNGLLKSFERYNPFHEPQTRFKTFAYFYIKDAILEAFRANKKNHNSVVLKPTFKELITDTEEQNLDLNRTFISLDVLKNIPEFELKFGLIDSRTPEDDTIKKTEEEYLVSRLKEILDEKELEIALHLISLEAHEQLTPTELAEKLNLTETRIYQLRNEIRKKLIASGLVKVDGKRNSIVWE
jgi:RNA polymerase sigma factor (sigma-70 family)